jgi:MYXO-CTERM domain-containing protein
MGNMGNMGNMGTGGATGVTGATGPTGANGATGPSDTSTTTVQGGGACNTTPGDPSSGLFSLLCVAGALVMIRRRAA